MILEARASRSRTVWRTLGAFESKEALWPFIFQNAPMVSTCIR
jgi:hypothetical protein